MTTTRLTRLTRSAHRHPTRLLLALAGCAMLCSTPARADPSSLSSTLQVHRVVVQADGSEALQPAMAVHPGDVLQYATVFSNPGARPVQNLQASLPIPPGTELVAASIQPRAVLASLDGKVFLPMPLMRKTRRADGQWVDVAVPLAEIRALRWPEQPLAAGASLRTSARVRISGAAVALSSLSVPAAASAVSQRPAPAMAVAQR